MKYIPADKLIAEIERQQRRLILLSNTEQVDMRRDCALQNGVYNNILSIIDSLQQEPRFPQYDNIVEKIFGAGNLEGWEFRDAEMLVALAKEELLKSLHQEQPEVDLDNHTIMEEIRKCGCNPNEFNVARHFYELGRLNTRKEE